MAFISPLFFMESNEYVFIFKFFVAGVGVVGSRYKCDIFKYKYQGKRRKTQEIIKSANTHKVYSLQICQKLVFIICNGMSMFSLLILLLILILIFLLMWNCRSWPYVCRHFEKHKNDGPKSPMYGFKRVIRLMYHDSLLSMCFS